MNAIIGVTKASLNFALILFYQCFTTIASAQQVSQEDFGWYFVSNKDLLGGLGVYDARTLEVIVKPWPGREVFLDPSEKDKVIIGNHRSGATRQYTNEGKPDDPLRFQDGTFLPDLVYFSADFCRLVYQKNGDLWICDVDWKSDRLVNNKKLTEVGVFQFNFTCYWFEDIIFVDSKYRIDTRTGEISEFDVGWFTQEERMSPDHRRIILKGDPYGVYDLLTGKDQVLGQGGNLRSYLWLDNNRFVIDWRLEELLYHNLDSDHPNSSVSSKEVSQNSSEEESEDLSKEVGKYLERHKPKIKIPFLSRYKKSSSSTEASNKSSKEFSNRNAVLRFERYREGLVFPSPGGRYFFLNRQGQTIFEEIRVLVDTKNWSVLPLPRSVHEIVWVGPEVFYYSSSFSDVSLKDRGTWVYNTTSKTEKKIAPHPFTSVAVLYQPGLVIFIANNDVWRAKTDGSEVVRLTNTGNWNGEVTPLISDHRS
ncbi:MAG: hypothetical protein ACE5IR_22800 [bacterium]